MVGRADHHGVEAGGGVQQFTVVAVGLSLLVSAPPPAQGDPAGALDLFRIGIADGNKLHPAGEQVAEVRAALVAAAQQGNSRDDCWRPFNAGLAPNRTIGVASAVAPKAEAAARKPRREVLRAAASAVAGAFRVIKSPLVGSFNMAAPRLIP